MANDAGALRRFCLAAQADEACGRPSTQPGRPVIGVTGNYVDGELRLAEAYYKSVLAAGGVPVVVPPVADGDVLAATLDRIDGLLLSGGADINPLFSGEEPLPALRSVNAERDLPELLAIVMAYNRQMPMLGICRGVQALAVALGGHVRQDIAEGGSLKHSQDARRSEPTHTVDVEEGTLLHSILLGERRIAVNSLHHQAVDAPGEKLRVAARAADGVVEAVESAELKSIVGVQWHPECLADGGLLFRWLVDEAAAYRAAQRLHDTMLTLDSHCDSPMLFASGADFLRRDPRLLVDLVKMEEGRLDASVLAAYIPQPRTGEPFAAPDGLGGTPTDYALRTLDAVARFAAASDGRLAVAKTTADLRRNKLDGRKSLMLAIENGLALGSDLSLVDRFADMGVVYVTLCHNGDNDICDSARGSATHGGLSLFGADVVARLNERGVLVDLSHAAESSFYDALQASAVPPVCSHSCCRALCDHPRNLTDDQMRALAKCGGVMQVTLYSGFLRSAGEATLLDAVAHVERAVSIMGADHVGIGTDFDGDGGVRGIASASEALNFTRQLLARRYSRDDIARIWGGNFMLAIDRAQQAARRNGGL